MNKKFFIALSFGLIVISNLFSQQLAFPGAEGFGKFATGGRYGSVYHVTNLNDAGVGSFRDAVSVSNRIIVFDVAGVIKLSSTLTFAANLYIAGQTAPGEGITVYGDRVTFSSANNTICRYMKFRMGIIGADGKDACGIANGSNMIFDHVSVSWGRDENFSINWDGKGTEPTNITIQNSIISQGLLTHSAGGLIQTNGGVTLYRNLYVDNSTRNNKVKGINQYVNNIVYNWNNAAYIMGGDSEGESFVNVVSNYFINGPENGGTPISTGNSLFHIYADDNWFDKNLDGTLNGYEIPYSEYSGGPDFQATPYNYPALPTMDASNLLDSILPSVGASLPYSDYVDYFVLNEVKSFGTAGALISNESTLPFGAPSAWTLWTGTTRIDTDNDGMPDVWEEANGTNKTVNDAMIIATKGYANIENYINGINKSSSQIHLRTPLFFSSKATSQNSITFSWSDYTRDEDGFILERYINGTFVPVDTADANTSSLVLTGFQPEEKDTFRLCAYNSLIKSDYTNSIIAKSKPIEVPVIDPNSYVPDITWSGLAGTTWDKSAVNWLSGSSSVAFTDSSKVLFGDTLTGNQTISVSDNMPVKAMFVKSDYNYSFSGTGYISGKGSMNKTGKGELTLGNSNTYTGANVIWDGTINASSIANGGSASSIGASANYAFNLVFKGGKLNYTGGASVSTDRNILLDETGNFSIANSGVTVTMTGTLTGAGGFIKSGNGTLKITNNIGNIYEGETTIAGGILDLNMNSITTVSNALGTSGIINLAGGSLKTTGQTGAYETYEFKLNIPEGKVGGFIPTRLCYIKSKVSGSGTFNFTIPYLREYIQGDWSEFTGILNAYGSNSTEGSQLLLNNTTGLPYARVNLTGNAKIINWATTGTMYLGGLSGVAGTYLGSASKQTDGTSMTWIIGGSGTDETFNGIINNDCSASGHYGVTTIVKKGIGIWRLTGNNVYTGTTTIAGGTLIVNGIHTGAAKVTVQSEAKLAGKGKLPGTVEVQTGAVIEPGDGSISNFTMTTLTLQTGCTVNMDINKTLLTNDKIIVNGAVTINGTLNLSITGTLAEGDQFTIFTGTSFSGSFEKIIPAIPGEGLEWQFSNGILKVVNPLTGIKEAKNSKAFIVSPNPVKNQANISFDKKYKLITVKIEDMNGKSVSVKSYTNISAVELKTGELVPGIYIVNILADGNRLPVARIIKE
jgi:autotransporter-associated beta strand protein